ncbi:hypothetical protein HU200_036031 [Digitaria exilis]|uniref:Uncharacterized protein n=1 Tax=Digitaria exilis TaxID=1010633 RepID=A0A835BEA6_9POAL|nr:hypothetical protein HU200_036031 [Digitaria exilis]
MSTCGGGRSVDSQMHAHTLLFTFSKLTFKHLILRLAMLLYPGTQLKQAASGPPPEGRNYGYLVVKGAADEETRCCGLFPDRRVRELPFPQNCVLKVRYTVNNGQNSRMTREEAIVFVPVPDQPLASNRYYAVIAKGKRKGLARACSRDEDMATCCFCRCINDVEPRLFHPADIYQQLEIVRRRRGWFTARAVAPDAFPSSILGHKYWRVYASESKKFNPARHRAWTPCSDQASSRWQIHRRPSGNGTPRSSSSKKPASRHASRWSVARSTRGGWVDEEEDAGKVAGGWVLVERFVVKRLDGRVVVAFEFVHLNKVRDTEL